MIYLELDPVAKPRMTQADRWKKRSCVLKYYNFKDKLIELCKEKSYVQGDRLEVVFHIKMPGSWTNKKQLEMLGTPHQSRPDIDNMVKAIMDSLCEEDSHIFDVKATKLWAVKGGIIFRDFENENHFV